MRFAIGAMMALASAGLPALRAQENVYDEINAAWEKRNKAVRTAEFEIKCEAFYSKGSISAQHPQLKSPTPPTDKITSVVSRLLIKDNWIRLENSGEAWDGRSFSQLDYAVTLTNNGTRSLEKITGKSPFGLVRSKSKDCGEMTADQFRPIVMCLRSGGDRPLFKLSPHKLTPAGSPVTIRDSISHPYREKSPGNDGFIFCFIPTREWICNRQYQHSPEGERIDIDINYIAHESGIPLPKSWELRTFFPASGASITKKYIVTQCKINSPINESAFEIPYPEGTNVRDDTWSQSLTGVVGTDGKYTPHPNSAPEDLERFHQAQRVAVENSRKQYLLWIGAALVVTSVLFVCVRRLRRNSQASSPRIQ